jgi:2-oxoglutarate ferredoxin oxidoreductase subunit delta
MIKIDEDLCKSCNICVEFCPVGVYEQSGNVNKKGVHVPIPVNGDKCTNCGLCTLLCPDQAITVDFKG